MLRSLCARVCVDGECWQIDLEELEEFLSEAGALELFGANNVQEVMAIFDADGSGTLEADEMEILMDFITGEKERMMAIAENRDSKVGVGAARRAAAVNVTERKFRTISKLEQSLATLDADGDGQVDVDEVRCCVVEELWWWW